MPTKLNTEFNYRYQVEGNTPWEKIKHLKNFLEGRLEAAALEKANELNKKAVIAKLEFLKKTNAEEYLILETELKLLEIEAGFFRIGNMYDLNRQEITILEKLLDELYAIVEPTRLKHPDGTPFTDEEMIEINAANEFTAMIGKEIYCEIVANGRPSPARVRNAMSNPHTLLALKTAGLLPQEMQYIEGSIDPLQIELKQTFFDNLKLSKTESLKIE